VIVPGLMFDVKHQAAWSAGQATSRFVSWPS
jgi:hypothetical protein